MTARTRQARPLSVVVSGAPLPAAARGLGPWLERAAPRSARGTVDIAILSDGRMRRLNASFRGVDKATDVLSFPADPAEGARVGRASDRPLGDIAIAAGVAARQARDQGHAVRTELRVLALHGLLHLLGYDHERDHGEMRSIEERLRRRAGLPVGLITRTPATTP